MPQLSTDVKSEAPVGCTGWIRKAQVMRHAGARVEIIPNGGTTQYAFEHECYGCTLEQVHVLRDRLIRADGLLLIHSAVSTLFRDSFKLCRSCALRLAAEILAELL